MKRFIGISLLAVTALRGYACAGIGTDNYYLFNVCDKQEFSTRVYQTTLDNWKVYVGSTEEYYWFDADEVTKCARQKGDMLMVSYVQQLQRYLKLAEEVRYDQWEYPTPAQLQQRRQQLLAIRTYALGKLKTRLRSQHGLLLMRCNMLLGRHAENVTFWEQTASQYIETVYRDMMQNIYAGALLKTRRTDEACRLYAEQGDWNSLMTVYYKKRSYEAIRQEYLRDANSAVLPFLLQDFVNNTQEAYDAEHQLGMEGKLFIRRIQRSEAQQMMRLAAQVVKEGKTQTPVLWQTAKAWLEHFMGSEKQALSDIQRAMTMEGTERMKDNARIICLYLTAAQQPLNRQYDNWLAGEWQWLTGKMKRGVEHYGDYYGQAADRVIHQVVGRKYADAGQAVTALALYRTVDSPIFQTMMDTMRVEALQQYMAYVTKPATTALERCLKPLQQADMTALTDLVGTKYMRQCRWEEAEQWIGEVPLQYYNEKGYAVYAANRRYTVEPWMQRQWLKASMEYSDEKIRLKASPKLAFVQEMIRMESELRLLTGKARQQRCYDLAVRYAQAHFTGDCWYLMRDGKSIGDTLRRNETDLAARALEYLRQASQTTDAALKERALFAMTYGGLYAKTWLTWEWDDKLCKDVARKDTKSAHYQAHAALLRYEQERGGKPSGYVSKCEEYDFFKKNR